MARDLEIDDDPGFDVKSHHVQRIGWCLLALFLLASAGGLLGPSRLSSRVVSDGSTIIEYPRFARRSADAQLKISVRNPKREEEEIWVSSEYLDGIKLHRVTPEPIRAESVGDGVKFTFAAEKGAPSLDVLFELKPSNAGALKGEIRHGLPPEKIALNQFVYF